MITLKTLPQATAQQVFDQVTLHLIKQARKSTTGRSIDYSPGCAYRSPSGLKCAAGCLISDDEYSTDFEATNWDQLVNELKVPHEHAELILGLQKIHDIMEVHTWIDNLKSFASMHNLNSLVLNDK